jgi:SagB-type dehydrogenase family enzyme
VPPEETKIYASVHRPSNAGGIQLSDAVIVEHIAVQSRLPLTPATRDVLTRMLGASVGIHELEAGAAVRGVEGVIQLELLLQRLGQSGLLELATAPQAPLASVIPISPYFTFHLPRVSGDSTYRLSRFSYLRRDDARTITVETPRGFARVALRRVEGMRLLYDLCEGTTIPAMLDAGGPLCAAEIQAFVQLLLMAAVIERCDDTGVPPEEQDAVLRQWDFHDLLFHSRSRMGRHDAAMGGTFRFRGTLDPRPAVKPSPSTQPAIALSRPDIGALLTGDVPLSFVLENRRSIRNHGPVAITVQELGHFLYRVARVRYMYGTDFGEFTSRPYPSGGASYELELYVAVDRCQGLARGLYHYDPLGHALAVVSPPTEDMELLLGEASVSAGLNIYPQLLLIIASRFQRVAWKYQGIAYATQLKNVGVLYATFYLVATAMNLAPCALGLGNSDRFCRLARTDYFEEGPVGEFMLGSRTASQ